MFCFLHGKENQIYFYFYRYVLFPEWYKSKVIISFPATNSLNFII
jgi:hypothetical protein